MEERFDLHQLMRREWVRQRDTINLIASENYPSPKVLELLGSVWNNKYAEGYPGIRYYAGNELADELETQVRDLALEAFGAGEHYGVNVQVLSGSAANGMVYLAALEPGDTILSLNLASGGHLSHLHQTSAYLKFFRLENYDVRNRGDDVFEVDLDDFKRRLEETRPKLTIIGFSAYPRAYEFLEFCRLAHEAGSLVLADIAHISGLVAAGLHDTPFRPGPEGADFVTTTTHKTLRGPRGALLFARKEHMKAVDRTVFPGTSGGPHLHQIAATGQALAEITGKDTYPDGRSFSAYANAVIATTAALERGLRDGGLDIVSPTQTHLCLVRLPEAQDSLQVQRRLEGLGIILNRNLLPADTKPPWRPSGLRLGTAALASRGLDEEDACRLGRLVAGVVLNTVTDTSAATEVAQVSSRLQWYYV